MVALRTKVEPEVCTYVDEQENTLIVEIVLPGVSKEDIRLKVNTRSLLLYAVATDVNYTKYMSFQHPVLPEKGRAAFAHELLRIKLPLRA
jgi:HSP20 family molecular chaperone IbpA